MDDAERAIAEFLQKADECYDEYDEGYVDADATLRRLRTHVDELRDARADGSVDGSVDPPE